MLAMSSIFLFYFDAAGGSVPIELELETFYLPDEITDNTHVSISRNRDDAHSVVQLGLNHFVLLPAALTALTEVHPEHVLLTVYKLDLGEVTVHPGTAQLIMPLSTETHKQSIVLQTSDEFVTPAGRWKIEWDEDGNTSHSMRPPPVPVLQEEGNLVDADGNMMDEVGSFLSASGEASDVLVDEVRVDESRFTSTADNVGDTDDPSTEENCTTTEREQLKGTQASDHTLPSPDLGEVNDDDGYNDFVNLGSIADKRDISEENAAELTDTVEVEQHTSLSFPSSVVVASPVRCQARGMLEIEHSQHTNLTMPPPCRAESLDTEGLGDNNAPVGTEGSQNLQPENETSALKSSDTDDKQNQNADTSASPAPETLPTESRYREASEASGQSLIAPDTQALTEDASHSNLNGLLSGEETESTSDEQEDINTTSTPQTRPSSSAATTVADYDASSDDEHQRLQSESTGRTKRKREAPDMLPSKHKRSKHTSFDKSLEDIQHDEEQDDTIILSPFEPISIPTQKPKRTPASSSKGGTRTASKPHDRRIVRKPRSRSIKSESSTPSRHRTPRSRTLSSGNGHAYDGPPPVVFFSSTTDIKAKRNAMETFKALGGKQAKSIDVATFLCVKDGPMKKTASFVMAVYQGKCIVTDAWVLAAHRKGYFPDPVSYLPDDPTREQEWKFDLKDALERGKEGPTNLLRGKTVYFTSQIGKELGELQADFAKIARSLGAEDVEKHIPTPHAAAVFPDMLIIGCHNDPEGAQVGRLGQKLYTKDVLVMAALRGKLELDSEEFVLDVPIKPEVDG